MRTDALLADLAEWAVTQRLEEIPRAVLARARQSLTDTVAVGIAGARLEVSKRIHAWASAQFRAGPAGLLGAAGSLTPPAAALVNGVACHALDFDDTCYDGIVHPSAVVLPAALAACEDRGTGGAELLLAYCVGCQIEIELARAFTNQLYDKGWFSTALLGVFGAAAASAKALGLSAEEYRAALALAAVEAAGIRAVLGSESKPYLAGRAAETGLRCALLARDGQGAPTSALEGPNGFIATHLGFAHPLLPAATAGTRWCFVDPGFALKRYPVCSAAQAAVEELEILRNELGLRLETIRRITAAGTRLVVRSLQYNAPRIPQQAQFSMPFALACMLRFGRLGPAELEASVLQDVRLTEFLPSVALVEDPALEIQAHDHACPEAARLVIELKTGTIIERTRLAASGMPQKPFSNDQLWQKFEQCSRFAGIQAPEARRLFENLQGVDELATLAPLSGITPAS